MWEGEAFEIRRPERQRLPLVVASPHSGDRYPDVMLQGARLSPRELRRSEDFMVQELAGDAPRLGAPLLHALFPRAYVDVNREPYELDPEL
ncbi:MAG TPA: N-formylglutamate amidohydrolase, partial [Kiloniellales bacterium]|nr:N-formylglutamate amidohydrolase [Kiloniellales bacterium]